MMQTTKQRQPIAATAEVEVTASPTLRARLTRSAAGVLAACLAMAALISPATARAATTGGYPSAIVQYGASTRTAPYLSNTYWGYALHDPGTSGNQTVSVMCWYDGDWATGNYTTNRWFRVLVWENYDGHGTPRWLFVHASYVYNQPSVRQCNNNGGIFS
jgi:hypothetical protein